MSEYEWKCVIEENRKMIEYVQLQAVLDRTKIFNDMTNMLTAVQKLYESTISRLKNDEQEISKLETSLNAEYGISKHRALDIMNLNSQFADLFTDFKELVQQQKACVQCRKNSKWVNLF